MADGRLQESAAVRRAHRSGTMQLFVAAGFCALCMIAIFGLLGLILVRGVAHFWPQQLVQFTYADPWEVQEDAGAEPYQVAGQIRGSEHIAWLRLQDSGLQLHALPGAQAHGQVERWTVRVGNRELYGSDFRQILPGAIVGEVTAPRGLLVLERTDWGPFFGYAAGYITAGGEVRETSPDQAIAWVRAALPGSLENRERIRVLERDQIGAVNAEMERLRLWRRKQTRLGQYGPQQQAEHDSEQARLEAEYAALSASLEALRRYGGQQALLVRSADGEESLVPVGHIVRLYQPNALGLLGKLGVFLDRLGEFIGGEPREANTEGGVLPAIFGTVALVLLMSVFVTPFGVVAAIYLSEYARQGPVVRLVRISVNNLAGMPSIVFGIVGLGLFVYALGGSLDALFFPDRLPSPTFGSPGILWASLTLALLTLPVVIVATEEGLRRVPREQREGALALGATKFESLYKVVVPIALPSALTGVILAIGRAAGEVAPLMLVGVVKYAPLMPVDGVFPYVHLDRTFMHLGFHIFDMGFQSPNVEAARPLIYATCLLLLALVLGLNLVAILLRERMRRTQQHLQV